MRPPWARRRRRGFRLTDRGTVAIGLLAGATVVAALVVELGRVWRRGSAPLPSETEDLPHAAAEAIGETVETVVSGYREGTARENAVFNLLVSFVVTLGLARGIAYGLRSRRSVGPFRSLRLGDTHVHHFVPGIVAAFVSGAAAIVIDNDEVERLLAIPFGIGMGLTLDESALLLELDDVYWTEEGVVGVQIALGVAAMLAALAIGWRFVRRGERLVLPHAGTGGLPAAPVGARTQG